MSAVAPPCPSCDSTETAPGVKAGPWQDYHCRVCENHWSVDTGEPIDMGNITDDQIEDLLVERRRLRELVVSILDAYEPEWRDPSRDWDVDICHFLATARELIGGRDG